MKLKSIMLLLFIQYYSEAKPQCMKKEKFPRIISKGEVQAFISSGEAVYDSTLSKAKSLDVYKFTDGRLIFKRADGKGAYWKSLEQIDATTAKAEKGNTVFNMKGWIKGRYDLSSIKQQSFDVLRQKIGKEVGYDSQSLSLVSKIKVDDILNEKDLFYSILYYSCEYCARKINGSIDIEKINDSDDYRPIVKDNQGRTYIPYADFLKSFDEKKQITIEQSIEIELHKYKFFK